MWPFRRSHWPTVSLPVYATTSVTLQWELHIPLPQRGNRFVAPLKYQHQGTCIPGDRRHYLRYRTGNLYVTVRDAAGVRIRYQLPSCPHWRSGQWQPPSPPVTLNGSGNHHRPSMRRTVQEHYIMTYWNASWYTYRRKPSGFQRVQRLLGTGNYTAIVYDLLGSGNVTQQGYLFSRNTTP